LGHKEFSLYQWVCRKNQLAFSNKSGVFIRRFLVQTRQFNAQTRSANFVLSIEH
jgi:hypothetical protein